MQNDNTIKFAELSDNELIDRFRYSHNNQYVGELYTRYAHLVLGLCIKYFKDLEVAKDATMGIFELLLNELKRHKIENFKSWLYTVSKNYCLQELRKKSSSNSKEDLYKVFISETMETEMDLHLHKEKENLILKMEQALPSLKYNQRLCLKMFYLEGKSYADISKELEFSLKDVKSHIQNGKRNLKIKMEEANVKK
ncbi:MAG: sigma-70 family RNA polymerase sigma factor [Chitinophagales bacterium]|nr:sigma-70 family RNA polymerase sigma factor [Chitinophagales bacterium]